MIHRIFGSLKSFKELQLHPGLNIILCEKTPGATDQQTRNRAGKSSVLDLIHFALGGKCEPDSTFRASALIEASFGLELDLGGHRTRVSRSGSEPSRVIVEQADTTHWAKQPKTEKDSGRSVISYTDWRAVLARASFGLGDEADSDDSPSPPSTLRPTFRQLFAYFARREASGGMRQPMQNAAMQQIGDMQIAISYLVGFDWTIAQQWEAIRVKEKQIKELKRIVGQGLLVEVLDTAASLRSRLVLAEDRLKRSNATLSSFRVHEQYHSLEQEASKVTRDIAEISDEVAIDRRYIEELELAMKAEAPPAPDDLKRLYEEAGVVLPGTVQRRYDDVLKFHDSVIKNRRSYLQTECTNATQRVSDREAKRRELDRRRGELMSMLKSHGALDEFIALQTENGRLSAEVEVLRRRHDAAKQLESTSSSLESERVRLQERLRQEFSDRSEAIDLAIRAFNSVVEELYGEPGQLEFHATHNGPDVRISIQGDRSRGIGNMEIFCFDMMIQRMCAKQNIGPGFLVHDSHLFDGVDPRQTGRALAVGAKLAEEIGFQYIVTMNSDALAELPANFRLERYALAQRLTDETESGGLFGMRFEPPTGERRESAPTKKRTSSKRKGE
jgi:uncharacterized protein YydD (DUF2326 family)